MTANKFRVVLSPIQRVLTGAGSPICLYDRGSDSKVSDDIPEGHQWDLRKADEKICVSQLHSELLVLTFLACSANLPEGLYILLALI